MWCGKRALDLLGLVTDPDLIQLVCRKLLEVHHPAGQNHDPELGIILCIECHLLFTLHQIDHRVPLRYQSNPLDRQIARAEALALSWQGYADAEMRNAEALKDLKSRLNDACPDWREKIKAD